MTTRQFRPIRGSLKDSMAEVVTVSNMKELKEAIYNTYDFAVHPLEEGFTEKDIIVERYTGCGGPEASNYDERIGWDTHLVMVKNRLGPQGFLDGPLDDPVVTDYVKGLDDENLQDEKEEPMEIWKHTIRGRVKIERAEKKINKIRAEALKKITEVDGVSHQSARNQKSVVDELYPDYAKLLEAEEKELRDLLHETYKRMDGYRVTCLILTWGVSITVIACLLIAAVTLLNLGVH